MRSATLVSIAVGGRVSASIRPASVPTKGGAAAWLGAGVRRATAAHVRRRLQAGNGAVAVGGAENFSGSSTWDRTRIGAVSRAAGVRGGPAVRGSRAGRGSRAAGLRSPASHDRGPSGSSRAGPGHPPSIRSATLEGDTVHLSITAQQGPGNLLGNLLCAVANLLNGPTGVNAIVTQIANLLNQLLGNLSVFEALIGGRTRTVRTRPGPGTVCKKSRRISIGMAGKRDHVAVLWKTVAVVGAFLVLPAAAYVAGRVVGPEQPVRVPGVIPTASGVRAPRQASPSQAASAPAAALTAPASGSVRVGVRTPHDASSPPTLVRGQAVAPSVKPAPQRTNVTVPAPTPSASLSPSASATAAPTPSQSPSSEPSASSPSSASPSPSSSPSRAPSG